MARLPVPGADDGNWGSLLNEFLEVRHNNDGTLHPTTLEDISGVINIKAFGAVGDGVTDDAPAIQAAIDSLPSDGGTVWVPTGTYLINSTIRLETRSITLMGQSLHKSVISPSGAISAISPRQSDCMISNMTVRTVGAGIGIHIQGAAFISVVRVLFLSGNTGSGTAILMDDRNESGAFVAGAYNHTIQGCHANRSGFLFEKCIETTGTSGGINNCNIISNFFLCDQAIVLHAGGGHRIISNHIASGTGNHSNHVGTGVTAPIAQILMGNYFESLENTVRITGGSLSNIQMIGNHRDNVTRGYAIDPAGSVPSFSTIDEGVESFAWAGLDSVYNLIGNNEEIDVHQSSLFVSGNGATRTGAFLGTSGVRTGQVLVIVATSWAFELVEGSTGEFGQYGTSMMFGQEGAGGVYRSASFMYDGVKWRCTGGSTYGPGAEGGAITNLVSSNGATVPVTHRTQYLDGNGSGRVNCLLANGVVDAQRVTLVGFTWSVHLSGSASNIQFGDEGAPTLSGSSQDVMSMEMLWVAPAGRWYEVSRTTRT